MAEGHWVPVMDCHLRKLWIRVRVREMKECRVCRPKNVSRESGSRLCASIWLIRGRSLQRKRDEWEKSN